MLFRTACNLKLRVGGYVFEMAMSSGFPDHDKRSDESAGATSWSHFSQEESGFILMAKRSHQSREWLDQIWALEWCSACLSGESGRDETRLWVGGLSCLASLSPTGLSTAHHFLGYSPHTLAGAGLDMGVVRTLRVEECTATSQTSRPGFFLFQNLDKLTSQMPGL